MLSLTDKGRSSVSQRIAVAAEHKEEKVLAAAIGGLSRVAEAILSLPYEQRVDAIDAAAESYRKTAMAFLSEEETERWLRDVLLRLRAEVAKRIRSSG
jgi:hypothetical protein